MRASEDPGRSSLTQRKECRFFSSYVLGYGFLSLPDASADLDLGGG